MPRTTLLLLCLCAAVASAQDRPEKKPLGSSHAVPRQQAALSDVLGAKVRLRPDAKERREAATENRTPEPTYAAIDDLVVDAGSGQTQWVVLATGGVLGVGEKLVAVPTSALTCAPDAVTAAPSFAIDVTAAQLQALPPFDKATIHVRREPIERNGRPRQPAVPAILASRVIGMPVVCSDSQDSAAFGSVAAVCVDAECCRLRYLIVANGGVLGIGKTEHLIPAVSVRVAKLGDAADLVLALGKSSTEMASAPKYVRPASGLVDVDCATAACEFHGVPCAPAKRHDGRPIAIDGNR
jgi:hypothetical protein